MSTFKVAGVSRLDGEFKCRFANDMTRVKVLAKNGHKDIDLIELKEPMTKEAAVEFLLSINFDNGNAEVRAALESERAKREPKPAKEPKARAVKEPKARAVKQPKEAKPTLEKIAARKPAKPATTLTREQIEAQLGDVEEAPF